MLWRFFKLDWRELDAEFLGDSLDTALADSAETGSANAEGNPTIFFGDIEALLLEVGKLLHQLLAIGVGNHVAHEAGFSGDFTNTAHN